MPPILKSEQDFLDRFVRERNATAERRKTANKRADCKAVFDPIDAIELKEAYRVALCDGDFRREAETSSLIKSFSSSVTPLQAEKLAAAIRAGGDLRRDPELNALMQAFGARNLLEARKAAHAAGKAAEKLTDRQKKLINRVEFIEYQKRINRDEMPQQTAKERVEIGYQWQGGWVAGKWYQSAFVEKGLRSDDHWLLARHVASTKKVSKGLFAGNGNGDARKAWNKKMPALDCTHTGMNTVVRDCFRIELDIPFKSESELVFLIEEAGCPMPNTIVWVPCETLAEGTVNKPHCWYYLPDKKGVYGTGNVSDRMLKGVAAALFAKLEHLGADPGGLANIHDGKSPLSPHARYYIANETHLPTLSELAEVLDVTLDDVTMARLMSIRKLERTTVGTRSNEVYDWCYATSSLLARELHKKGIVDTTALDFDCYRFAEIIETEMHARAKAEFPEFKGAELDALLACCSARATWAAEKFDGITLSGGVNRGAAADLIRPTDDLTAKKAAGGTYARAKVMNDNIKLIAKSMLPDLKADKAPNADLIANNTGLHIKTVRNRWDAALKVAQGIIFQQVVSKIAMALTPICKGIKLSWVGDTLGTTNLNQSTIAQLQASNDNGQPSTVDPETGDPGQPPNPCAFEDFAEAYRHSRRAEASGNRVA